MEGNTNGIFDCVNNNFISYKYKLSKGIVKNTYLFRSVLLRVIW